MLSLRIILYGWLTALLLLPAFCMAQNTAADQDELLNLLQEQLNNQLAKLNRPDLPIGYLAFEVEEKCTSELYVASGSPYRDNYPEQQRHLTVYCSVGFPEAPFYSLKKIRVQLPLYNDKDNIVRCVEKGTREAYKDSYSNYLSFQRDTFFHCSINSYNDETPLHTDTFHYDEHCLDNHYDQATVLEKLCNLTQQFSEMQYISDCEVRMGFDNHRTYYVSSRNGAVVYNTINTTATLKMCTGGRCLRQVYEVEFPDDLPVLETLKTDASMMYDALAQFSFHPVHHSLLTKPSPIEENFQSSVFEDVAFKAMEDEIAANLSELSWQGQYPPYAIRYLITDAQLFNVVSAWGSTLNAECTHTRTVNAEVNIGNDVFNNLHFEDCNSSYGELDDLPLDNNYTAMRQSIREKTFNSYEDAVEEYVKKCDYLKTEGIEMSSLLPDRTEADRADVHTHPTVAPISMDPVDLQPIQNLTDALSKMFCTSPISSHITDSKVCISGLRGNGYLLSSDGTRIIQPVSELNITLEVWLDNRLFTSAIHTVTDFNQLDNAELDRWVSGFITETSELYAAPRMDEVYDGPVLLAGNAAAKFFASMLSYLTAYREPLLRDYYPEVFHESRLDQRIFSPMMDITATDTVSSFAGLAFTGTYSIDADGVAPIPDLELVRRGELVTLLSNREPTKQVAHSNGHHRMGWLQYSNRHNGNICGAGLACAPGVTQLSSHKKLSTEKLEKLLLQTAREQGYRYAYVVTDYDIESATAYRINVSTGKRTMVSNSFIYSEGVYSFRNLTATSNRSIGYNTHCYSTDGTMHISVIVPDGLLFSHLKIVPCILPFVDPY